MFHAFFCSKSWSIYDEGFRALYLDMEALARACQAPGKWRGPRDLISEEIDEFFWKKPLIKYGSVLWGPSSLVCSVEHATIKFQAKHI